MTHFCEFVAHRRESDGTPQSVEEHLTEVARAASDSARKFGLSKYAELAGLLHDLGKYSKEFQDYIAESKPSGSTSKVDHSTAGAQFVWQEFLTKNGISAATAQFLSMCIASHHGGLIDCLTPEGEDKFTARIQKDDEKVHLKEVLGKVERGILKQARHIISDFSNSHDMEESLKSICDEEKSIEESGRENRIRFKWGLLIRMIYSCIIDADRTNSADFEKPDSAELRSRDKYVPWDILVERFEKHLKSFQVGCPIDGIRRRISEECLQASERDKGIFTLTVPTGGGKTLASLRFALRHAKKWSHDRIIYIVPFTTIIDQNARETREILEHQESSCDLGSVVLEHHSNLLPDQETEKTKLLSENWDARVIYTTMVQLLESFFGSGTGHVRRLHRLANAVIIFDEIQALPVKTVHLFCNAINFLVDQCGSTVILCTATQPLLDKVDRTKGAIQLSKSAEIIKNAPTLFEDLKRVEVIDRRKTEGWTVDETADLAMEMVENEGSCLVIVNTKQSAHVLYILCKQRLPETDICHLSTNMCPMHRIAVLKKIEKRIGKKGKPPAEPGPLLCISTQLIEAGVDVDFGSVIRFVAGLDSIAQAAGRCNRNNHRNKGIVTIINPAEENLRNLEDIRIGRETAIRVFDEFADDPESLGRDLLSPKAMERYFLYYFFERKHLMDYPIRIDRDDTLLNMLSTNKNAVGEYQRRNNASPEIYFRQSFKTAGKAFKAIDAPTRGIIVPYGKDGQALINRLCATTNNANFYSLLREAQRYSVNVFPWILNQLDEKRAVHEVQKGTGIFYLDVEYYSPESGLNIEAVCDLPFLNT